jgi:hypothetical protein
MRTCVVRRQFYTSEINLTVMIHAEPGFGTPKAAICYYATTNAAIDSFDTTTIQQSFGIGFMTGTGTTAGVIVGSTQQDAVGTTVTRTSNTSGAGPIFTQVGAGAGASNIWRTTGSRFVNGGMLITFAASSTGITIPPNQRLDVVTTFFTGSDLQVERFETSVATATGIGITFNVGFRPKLVIGVAARAVSGAGQGFSYGFATRTPGTNTTTVASQGSCAQHFSDGIGNVYQRMRHSRYFAEQCPIEATPGAAQTAWECDSFNSTGVRFVVRNASHTVNAFMGGIAMTFQGDYFGSSFSTLNTTGNKRSVTNFTPQIVIGALSGATAANALSAASSPNSDSFSIFVGTGGTTTKNRYGIGTMTVSSSATAVTGTGTSFFSQLAQGNRIYNTSGTLIGSVGAVNSNTSMTLSAGATNAMSSANFFIQAGSQHSIIYGNEFDNGSSNAYTAVTRGLKIARISGGAPASWVEANFNPFNRRPSFVLNYTTADATPRFGWFLAIEDENRRSDPS